MAKRDHPKPVNDKAGPPLRAVDARATFPDPEVFAQPAQAYRNVQVFYGSSQLWEQVANALLDQIRNGRYPIGAKLPSIRQLRDDFQVADGTAQRALRALTESGIAQPADRSGYYVTAIPATPALAPSQTTPAYAQTQSPQQLQRIPPVQPLAQPDSLLLDRPVSIVPIDADPAPELTTLARLTVNGEQAPTDIGRALRLTDAHGVVIVRRRLFTDNERHIPTELRTSYTTLDAVDGAPLMASTPIAEPWSQALVKHACRTPAATTTYANARRPTDHETAALALTPTAIVLVRDTITADEAGQPIDLTRSVWPAESTTLHHQSAQGPR